MYTSYTAREMIYQRSYSASRAQSARRCLIFCFNLRYRPAPARRHPQILSGVAADSGLSTIEVSSQPSEALFGDAHFTCLCTALRPQNDFQSQRFSRYAFDPSGRANLRPVLRPRRRSSGIVVIDNLSLGRRQRIFAGSLCLFSS